MSSVFAGRFCAASIAAKRASANSNIKIARIGSSLKTARIVCSTEQRVNKEACHPDTMCCTVPQFQTKLVCRPESSRLEATQKADAFCKPVKHVNLRHMKTVTVRDLRQRWPETEKALQTEQEILVTRDSKPVAKLVRYVDPDKPRKRLDPTSHGKGHQKMSRGEITRWVDEGLIKERDER